MKLTDEEKRLLEGEQGSVKQRCMQFLQAYGEACGSRKADRYRWDRRFASQRGVGGEIRNHQGRNSRVGQKRREI